MANPDRPLAPPLTRRWLDTFLLKKQGRMSPISRQQLWFFLVTAAAILHVLGSTYSITHRVRSTAVEAQAFALLNRIALQTESQLETLRRDAQIEAWINVRARSRGTQEARTQEARTQPRPFDWSREAHSLLRMLEGEGLRCLAIFEERGFRETTDRLLASAGCTEPSALPAQLRETPQYQVVDLGDRARIVRYSRGSQQALLIEFVPRVTKQLDQQALSSQRTGFIWLGALLVSAIFYYVRFSHVEPPESRSSRARRLAMFREMSATLSREIHPPLTSMQGRARLLTESLPSGSGERQQADFLAGEAERLARLTDDLLTLGRSSRTVRIEVGPAAVLRQAAEAVGATSIDLDVSNAPDRWSLDPDMARQALSHLLTNALQASPGDLRVTAVAQQEGDRLVFTIRDHGAGLPADDRERIFEPFYTTRAGGTGLGLTLAQQIVDLHGGTLTAADHPEGGAVLRATFPEKVP